MANFAYDLDRLSWWLVEKPEEVVEFYVGSLSKKLEVKIEEIDVGFAKKILVRGARELSGMIGDLNGIDLVRIGDLDYKIIFGKSQRVIVVAETFRNLVDSIELRLDYEFGGYTMEQVLSGGIEKLDILVYFEIQKVNERDS